MARAGSQAVRALLDVAYAGVSFPITWSPIAPGAALPLGKGRDARSLRRRCTRPAEPALGYRVVETQATAEAGVRGLAAARISKPRARHGPRDEMLEDFRHIVFAHSGDAMPLAPALVRGADLLVHDATFLEPADRREPIHASTAGGARRSRARPRSRTLVLHHLSIRYDRPSALGVLREQVAASGFMGQVWLLDERWTDLTPREVRTENQELRTNETESRDLEPLHYN